MCDNHRPFPKVLLLGNGLNRNYGANSWNSFLKSINVNTSFQNRDSTLPMPLQAILLTNNNIKGVLAEKYKGSMDNGERNKNHWNELYGSIVHEDQRNALRRILKIGFDHILTTNYSYELEIAASDKSALTSSQIYKYAKHTCGINKGVNKVEQKYLLHSYNAVTCEGTDNCIWHIHGEARKQDSMILGHYYYGMLFTRIKKYLDNIKDNYLTAYESGQPYNVQSWIDAFILGDVYILGLEYDPSEFDLWWLLNRKIREKAPTGKIYFMEPEEKKNYEKIQLMKAICGNQLEILSFGAILPPEDSACLTNRSAEEQAAYRKNYEQNRDSVYASFYSQAINYLESIQ